jgi:outer membrane immunogenic protein
MKFRYLAAAVALTVVPATAQAADFTGGRIGLVGGWDDITLDNNNLGIDRSTSGATFGIVTGYHFPIGSGAIIGIGTSTMFSNNEKKFKNGAATLKLSAERDLEIAAKIGAILGESALIYAKVGYANAKVTANANYNIDNKGDLTKHSETGDGLRLGVGTEIAISGPVNFIAEYRYSDYSNGFSRNQIVGGLVFSF